MAVQKLWAVRAGALSEAEPIFFSENQIALSYAGLGPEIASLQPSRSAFKEAFLKTQEGSANPESAPARAGQLYRFVREIRIGDQVIYPRKVDRTLHWGTIIGPYVCICEGNADFAHRRNVRWERSLSRDVFSQGALYEIGSALSLFEVKSFSSEFRHKFESEGESIPQVPTTDETNETVARHVDETTKDFVSKMIKTNLKGYALEEVVSDLFRAMKYNTNTTQLRKDDGIDVIAHRDELGIEPPIIKIQVKSQDSNISSDTVKSFCAMIHERDVGVFITTGNYTSAALDFTKSKSNIKLVNGATFVDLILKYYDELDIKTQQKFPLRRVLIPNFKIGD